PAPPGSRAEGLPTDWEQTILRSLHAEPVRRFRSAGAIVRALEADRASTRRERRPPWRVGFALMARVVLIAAGGRLLLPPIATSISVYEFENQTANPSFNYMCAGTTDELMRRLSRVPGIRLLPMRATRPDARQPDGSRFALSGRLQASGGRISLAVS